MTGAATLSMAVIILHDRTWASLLSSVCVSGVSAGRSACPACCAALQSVLFGNWGGGGILHCFLG
jgi:hypothetical protein